MNVIETSGLGKRYGRTWALRECTLMVPAGQLAVLVGPNGAGKTTLMNIAVGLSLPTAGTATVLGGQPGRGGHWTVSRSSRRMPRRTGTCPPGACCT
jgi:ABC-type multidrug transport system ATPase subunit